MAASGLLKPVKTEIGRSGTSLVRPAGGQAACGPAGAHELDFRRAPSRRDLLPPPSASRPPRNERRRSTSREPPMVTSSVSSTRSSTSR